MTFKARFTNNGLHCRKGHLYKLFWVISELPSKNICSWSNIFFNWGNNLTPWTDVFTCQVRTVIPATFTSSRYQFLQCTSLSLLFLNCNVALDSLLLWQFGFVSLHATFDLGSSVKFSGATRRRTESFLKKLKVSATVWSRAANTSCWSPPGRLGTRRVKNSATSDLCVR